MKTIKPGDKYGSLTVIKKAPRRGRNTMWLVRCDCGNVFAAYSGNIGKNKGCASCKGMRMVIDETGKRYGLLTVLGRTAAPPRADSTKAWWLVRCECGAEFPVTGVELRMGRRYSCGCKKRSRIEIQRHHGAEIRNADSPKIRGA